MEYIEENKRRRQLEELSTFIDKKQEFLFGILEKTEWTLESLKGKKNVQCPHDPNHWITESALEKHSKVCSLVQKGYSKEELEKEPPSPHAQFASAVSVSIDQQELNNILAEVDQAEGRSLEPNKLVKELPHTMDRYCIDFTPQERLAIYDYIVKKSKSVGKPSEVSMQDLMIDFEQPNEQGEKPKTLLEILAEQRDYKRRRQSYRAKNVHVTKKSYTEVMKEVIENQMQYFMACQKQEEVENQHKQKSKTKETESRTEADSNTDYHSRSEESSDDSTDKKREKKHRRHHKRRHSESHSRHSGKYKKHKKHRHK